MVPWTVAIVAGQYEAPLKLVVGNAHAAVGAGDDGAGLGIAVGLGVAVGLRVGRGTRHPPAAVTSVLAVGAAIAAGRPKVVRPRIAAAIKRTDRRRAMSISLRSPVADRD